MARGDRALREADNHAVGMLGLSNWPADEDGKPLVLIGFQMSELIGLPEYSNVTVGPAFAMRFVKDVGEIPDSVEEGFKTTVEDVEKIMREKREVILNLVKRQTAP